jgi:hypothetical protein
MLKSNKGHFMVKVSSERVYIEVTDTSEFGAWAQKAGDAKLLKYAVEKWQFIVDLLAAGANVINDGGVSTCALCQHYDPWGNGCSGCPVFTKTRYRSCSGTGYSDFAQTDDVQDQKAAAQRELELLQLLLAEAKSKGEEKRES